jgi:1-phosphatidylinositol-4-phosphate 5-kinase
MTLPANNDSTTLPAQSHYQPAPYNFSRPHPPPGSAASMHSGHTLTGASPHSGGHIGVNGVLQGPTSVSRGPGGGAPEVGAGLNRKPSATTTTPSPPPQPLDRDVRTAAKQMSPPPPPPPADGAYFPSYANGSASVKPMSNPASPMSMASQECSPASATHCGIPPRRLSQSPPPPAGPSSSQQQLQSPQTGSIRQRHTLQVPKPQQGSRTSTPASGSDAITTTGRFSPTSSSTPRRPSVTLGRRPTRSIHSENHLDEVPPDEDAARWTEAIKAKRANKKRKEEEFDEDKVVVGTKVDHNHVNWVTAYNMLTGIRFCVSRINAKMDRELTDQDFEAKHKFSFDM